MLAIPFYGQCRCDCGRDKVTSGVLLQRGRLRAAAAKVGGRRDRRRKAGDTAGTNRERAMLRNAELMEIILAWQKEEEPDRLLAILAKLAP
jgi:hypothetical protein